MGKRNSENMVRPLTILDNQKHGVTILLNSHSDTDLVKTIISFDTATKDYYVETVKRFAKRSGVDIGVGDDLFLATEDYDKCDNNSNGAYVG